jgi:hypothetical protein
VTRAKKAVTVQKARVAKKAKRATKAVTRG